LQGRIYGVGKDCDERRVTCHNREDFVGPTTDEKDKRDGEKILSLSSLLSVVENFGCGSRSGRAMNIALHKEGRHPIICRMAAFVFVCR